MDNNQESFQPRSKKNKQNKKIAPPAKQKKQQKSNSHIVIRKPLAIILLLMIGCFSAIGGYKVVCAMQPPIDISTLPADQQQAIKEERALNNINILVLGCDEREAGEKARADTIIMATLRPDDKEVSLLSVPRDTRVAIPGRKGKDKINHSMAYGGMPLITETVEDFLDVKIDYTVKVNFDGFINVIDALGGVTIDVPERMYKPLENIDLKKGVQTLDGYDALAFVRYRGGPTADLGRIERQQQFITALADQVKGMSLTQALAAGEAILNSIETDMSIADMTRYGTKFLGITAEDIETHSLVCERLIIDGVDYLDPDPDNVKETMDLMKYGNPEPVPTPEDPTTPDDPDGTGDTEPSPKTTQKK